MLRRGAGRAHKVPAILEMAGIERRVDLLVDLNRLELVDDVGQRAGRSQFACRKP